LIGENVKRLAGLHLVSHVELAEFVGLSRQGMQNILSGKSQPSVKTLDRLARAFGIRLDDLLADPKQCLRAAVEVLEDAPAYLLYATGQRDESGKLWPVLPEANKARSEKDRRAVLREVSEANTLGHLPIRPEPEPKVRKPRARVPRSLQRAGKPDKS
jgi:transcriptional regulator with XRE-family HTH domain